MANPTDTPLDQFSQADDVLGNVLDVEAEPTVEVPNNWQSFVGRLLVNRDLAILGVAVLMVIVFAATSNFMATSNLVGIMRRVALMGIVAVGMTYLFVAGELDLSVGSNYGFLVTLMAFFVVLRNVD